MKKVFMKKKRKKMFLSVCFYAGIVTAAILYLIVYGFLFIWSVNSLFNLQIPFNVTNIIAGGFLVSIVSFGGSSRGK